MAITKLCSHNVTSYRNVWVNNKGDILWYNCNFLCYVHLHVLYRKICSFYSSRWPPTFNSGIETDWRRCFDGAKKLLLFLVCFFTIFMSHSTLISAVTLFCVRCFIFSLRTYQTNILCVKKRSVVQLISRNCCKLIPCAFIFKHTCATLLDKPCLQTTVALT